MFTRDFPVVVYPEPLAEVLSHFKWLDISDCKLDSDLELSFVFGVGIFEGNSVILMACCLKCFQLLCHGVFTRRVIAKISQKH